MWVANQQGKVSSWSLIWSRLYEDQTKRRSGRGNHLDGKEKREGERGGKDHDKRNHNRMRSSEGWRFGGRANENARDWLWEELVAWAAKSISFICFPWSWYRWHTPPPWQTLQRPANDIRWGPKYSPKDPRDKTMQNWREHVFMETNKVLIRFLWQLTQLHVDKTFSRNVWKYKNRPTAPDLHRTPR